MTAHTSFIVSVVTVDTLNFLAAFAVSPFVGDIMPLVIAFTRRNGAVKSSRNVIK